MKVLIISAMSSFSTMSACTCIRVRCVSLSWVIVLLSQVLSRLRVEKLLSEEATEIGRHKQSLISFSTSPPKRALLCGWSSARSAFMHEGSQSQVRLHLKIPAFSAQARKQNKTHCRCSVVQPATSTFQTNGLENKANVEKSKAPKRLAGKLWSRG